MKRILLLVFVLVSVISFGISENIAYAYGSRPFINYGAYSDNSTAKNYGFMYQDRGGIFLFMTMGQGYSKTCIVVDEFDIDKINKGLIDDYDLAKMSNPCKNYKFGNNIHCVYRKGDVEFVVLCNLAYRTMRIFAIMAGEKEYLIEYEVDLLGIS